MRFKHILVVGVGLIGGSFAMAARRFGLADRITGLDNSTQLEEAVSAGVIDGAEEGFGSSGSTCDADLIYLSCPVRSIIAFLRESGRFVRPGTLVTDAGSTKREICLAADESLPQGVRFVGGHPMAGSHLSGLGSSSPDLFQGAPYAVVPAQNSSAEDIEQVAELARALGASPEILTPSEHDHAVALVSHAPQLLSTALALSTPTGGDVQRLTRLAGKGFSDCIRLAAGHWPIWEDICRTNSDEIDFALMNLIRELELLRLNVKTGDFKSLGNSFIAGSEFARKFLKAKASSKSGQ
ncbi:MAG TPA: prephenate dehydrogenase [Blastocatellia bacterium]|nr:prephenate dehydrogenase [Blastocatellia bacterium]